MAFNLNDLADHFDSSASARKDATANQYGVTSNDDAEWLYGEVVGEFVRIVAPAPHAKILDVGCGTGEILRRVAVRCPDTCGLDLSPAMVEIVKAKGHHAVSYDGRVFPFEDGSFDLVVIYQVFINLPSADIARNLLREAVRVTRKGGKVFVGAVPHPERSGLPTHDLAWWVNTKIALRKLARRPRIPYYSYEYAFFEAVARALKLERPAFVPCAVPRKGWDTKYHVLLAR